MCMVVRNEVYREYYVLKSTNKTQFHTLLPKGGLSRSFNAIIRTIQHGF